MECQPEELRVVEATAKQYRWTDLKKRGDELFAEGQYPACRACTRRRWRSRSSTWPTRASGR